MALDRLDALLQRFSLEARLFHSGVLCGTHQFDAQEGRGFLHLVRRGPLTIHNGKGKPVVVEEPAAIFYPGPRSHAFATHPKSGADLVCASVRFGAGAANPIVQALPPFFVVPLRAIENLEPALRLLFAEAFGRNCGRQAAINRLFEVVIIQILRFAMVEGRTSSGMLAGLAHAGLARAIVAMHEKPSHAWTLEELGSKAGMSRSRFASHFRDVVGLTPGAYLAAWRITVAQDLLRKGRPLKHVAEEVGYASAPALSRAFRTVTSRSPREWMKASA
ncbi:MAG TPA: AraC family transcriptional regulator [Usitatibacter sp.]|jgi:AraC-like DNA-binding protein|nr:AraC family transcriptional regulator [Usitatibacter sp.]